MNRELRLKLSADVKGFKDIRTAGKKTASDLQRQNKKTESTFSRLTKSIKGSKLALAGVAAVAFAAFIAYRKLSDFISRSIRESAEQVTIFTKLAASLGNVGVAYDDVRDSLNAQFLATQRATVFGDTEQAQVLQKLIAFTRDYDTAVAALPTTIDFAVGAGLDLNSAARLLGQALDGNLTVITRYETSLKGFSQETFNAMTKTEQLDLVLGALDKRYKGIAEAVGNTYKGALAQLTNAQGDLKEAVGDFITQSPVVIALIKTIAESYLSAADRVAEYRESQEKSVEQTTETVDSLIDTVQAVITVGNALGAFARLFQIVFNGLNVAIKLTQNVFIKWQQRVIDGILKINSILPDRLKIISPEDVALFQQTSTRLADDIDDFTDGPLRDSLDSMQDAINGFGKNIDAALQGGQLDEFKKQFKETLKEVIKSSEEGLRIRDILLEIGGALDDAAEDAKELGEEVKTITELFEDFVDANNLFELARKSNPTQGPALFDDIFGDAEDLEEAEKEITGTLSAVGVFAADIASNINDSFANTLTELIFDFKNFGDSIKNVFKSIANSFFQLLATIATNPIRIGIEQSLSGGGGSVVGAGGSILGIGGAGGLFGSSGSFTALGALFTGNSTVGFLSTLGAAIPAIGLIVAAAAIAIPLIAKAFEKTPRLDLDFDTFRDDMGKSLGIAAEVGDFLNKELFESEIFNNSVSRQAGLGLKGKIAPVIQEAIEGTIFAIQDIINQLPSDVAALLNEQLLNTSIDIESKIKGDRLLEFDETKKIAEKFEQFINGDLQARFLFSIREFFVGAFESLGVLGQAAQDFIDQEFENFQGLNREERAIAGQQLLQDFQTLVDAFNVLNGGSSDSIGATINQLKNLSSTLGFEAVPSIAELDSQLQELVNAAVLDPSVIQDMLDLRNAILAMRVAVLSSISSIISKISSLNATISGGGGSAIPLGGFLQDGIDSVFGLLGAGGLSLDDQEALLGLGVDFANQLLAEEQAIFNTQLAAQQAQAEAFANEQRANITAAIDGLNEEREAINENFDLRLEALNEELQLAQDFLSLTESLKSTLNSIILGPSSVFTAVERLNLVQSDIASTQAALNATTDPSKQLELAAKLEESFTTLFDLAGEAFGVNSPEFVAIFDQVTGGLEDLIDLTDDRTRSVEEINASIEQLGIERNLELERIDIAIDALNNRLSNINTQVVDNTFQMSGTLLETFEFLRGQYIEVLEARFEQLAEIDAQGFATEIDALTSIDHTLLEIAKNTGQSAVLAAEDAITLREGITALQSTVGGIGGIIQNYLDTKFANVQGFAHGSGGFKDFGSGTLTMLHGKEAVVPAAQFGTGPAIQAQSIGPVEMNVDIQISGKTTNAQLSFFADQLGTRITKEAEQALARSVRGGGLLRGEIQNAK